MTAWFGPQVSPWFSMLSLMSLVACVAPWVARGQHKALVKGIYMASVAFGALLLVTGIIARFLGQPDYVSDPLVLAGIVISIVFAATMPVMLKGYAEAEARKIAARDI